MVEEQLTQRIVAEALSTASDPVAALRAGARAFLDACVEPEVERILLLDAPGVLGWQRWREIGQRYGLGVITAALQAAIDAGALADQPVRPLAHILMGALDEAALMVAQAPPAGRAAEREAVLAALDGMLVGGS